jgi:protein tyrosine phosphatase
VNLPSIQVIFWALSEYKVTVLFSSQIKNNGCDKVKVLDVLLDMRRQRMGLIQTPAQLRFSYQAILEGMKTDWDSINDVSNHLEWCKFETNL